MKEQEVKRHLKDQIRSGRLPYQRFHIEEPEHEDVAEIIRRTGSGFYDSTPKDVDRTRRMRARKDR